MWKFYNICEKIACKFLNFSLTHEISLIFFLIFTIVMYMNLIFYSKTSKAN